MLCYYYYLCVAVLNYISTYVAGYIYLQVDALILKAEALILSIYFISFLQVMFLKATLYSFTALEASSQTQPSAFN